MSSKGNVSFAPQFIELTFDDDDDVMLVSIVIEL